MLSHLCVVFRAGRCLSLLVSVHSRSLSLSLLFVSRCRCRAIFGLFPLATVFVLFLSCVVYVRGGVCESALVHAHSQSSFAQLLLVFCFHIILPTRSVRCLTIFLSHLVHAIGWQLPSKKEKPRPPTFQLHFDGGVRSPSLFSAYFSLTASLVVFCVLFSLVIQIFPLSSSSSRPCRLT